MVFTAADGIHVMDMASRKTRLLVPNPPSPANSGPGAGWNAVHAVVEGHKTNLSCETSRLLHCCRAVGLAPASWWYSHQSDSSSLKPAAQ
jgi:hypothetical protein